MVLVGPKSRWLKVFTIIFWKMNGLKTIPVIGPGKEGAQLEGSKDFAKKFMMRQNIPTARYFSVNSGNLEDGISFLRSLTAPYV